jgi:hypothetical protein
LTWKKYLRHAKAIAKAMNLSVATINKWKSSNRVPASRFKALQEVLIGLGHELTPVEMGKLNNKAEE